MNLRPDKPREYFARLLNIGEEDIDYSEIPATAAADWEGAEVLIPVSEEEFRAVKQFISRKREQASEAET